MACTERSFGRCRHHQPLANHPGRHPETNRTTQYDQPGHECPDPGPRTPERGAPDHCASADGADQPHTDQHTHGEPQTSTNRGSTGTRSALRREIPCTLAVLVGEEDFTAMCQYPTFPFADYGDYLQHIDDLLRSLNSRGITLCLTAFDPEAFEQYCRSQALTPDDPVSRARYAVQAAAFGTVVPFSGQSLPELVQALLLGTRCRTTGEAADRIVSSSSQGRHAVERMTKALASLEQRAGTGSHQLVCSIALPGSPLWAEFQCDSTGDVQPVAVERDLFCKVLAAGMVMGSAGAVVLRTKKQGGSPSIVRGWALHDGWLWPLTDAEVFNAYCTDHRTGDPIAPEPSVVYEAGYLLRLPDGER